MIVTFKFNYYVIATKAPSKLTSPFSTKYRVLSDDDPTSVTLFPPESTRSNVFIVVRPT